jgi:hypothetical protein
LVLGTVLTAAHPNRKSRFLHTWIVACWAAAGAGLACLASGPTHGGLLRRGAGWCAAAGMWAAGLPSLAVRPSVPDSGNWMFETSLAVANQWLPWLGEEGPHAIFANRPIENFATWTYLETFPARTPPEVVARLLEPQPAVSRERFERWLDATKVQRLVYLHIETDSPLFFPDFAHYEQVSELLKGQQRFRRTRQVYLSSLRCTVSLWERVDSYPPAASRSTASFPAFSRQQGGP